MNTLAYITVFLVVMGQLIMDVVDFGFGQGEEQITPRGGEGDGDCVRGFQKIV